MKWSASVVLMLISSLAQAQVIPHVTQPYSYLWDYPTTNLTGTPSILQVAHFEIQLDALPPISLGLPFTFTPAATAGFSTFRVAADPATALGSHSFNVLACPTLVASSVAASGCVAGVAFPFVLDPKPLPSAQRLGVGV